MGFLWIILYFAGFLIFKIFINHKNGREWHENLFEPEEKSENKYEDPLLEAYISLGALMIRKDRASYSEKLAFMNSYFAKNFSETHYHFGRSFTDSLKNPVKPKNLIRFLNRKLPHREQRIQIMYFLAGLSTIDGSMNQKEIDLLKEMNGLLGLSKEDFDSIIAMYTQRKEQKTNTRSAKPRLSAIQLASKIMGISVDATSEEIKKAYRKLVKLHHPDQFALESIEQQEIAEERFIEIQKAYEILKLKKTP